MTLVKLNQNNVPVMSSMELAEFTGKPHNDLMKAIRKMFEAIGQESTLGNFSQRETYNNNNQKTVYLLPEKEALFVASKFRDDVRWKIICEFEELKKQTQLPATTGNPLLDALIATQLQVQAQQTALENKLDRSEFEERIGALEKHKELYTLDDGFMRLRDFHEKHGASISYYTLKVFLGRTVIPVKPYCFYTLEGVYIETKQVHIERAKKLIAHILTHAKQVSPQRWEHPDLAGYRFKINLPKDL